jgi:hypothetical protein
MAIHGHKDLVTNEALASISSIPTYKNRCDQIWCNARINTSNIGRLSIWSCDEKASFKQYFAANWFLADLYYLRLVPTRLGGTLAKCQRGEVTSPSTRPNWRDQTDRCWAPTRQRQLTYVRVNEGRRTWLGTDEAKVTPFINIFRLLLRRGNGNVVTEFRRHKATHNHYAVYHIWLRRRLIYLTTIERSLIGGFPQARLADVINRTRPTGPGNRRTTQFSLQVRPLLKHDAEDGRRQFFRWSCILYIQERINEICGSRICVHVSPLHYIIFLCLRPISTKQNGTPSGTRFSSHLCCASMVVKKKRLLVRGRCIWLNDAYSKDMPPGLYTKEEQQSCRIIKRTSCMLM